MGLTGLTGLASTGLCRSSHISVTDTAVHVVRLGVFAVPRLGHCDSPGSDCQRFGLAAPQEFHVAGLLFDMLAIFST